MDKNLQLLISQLELEEDGKITIKRNFELYEALQKLIQLSQSEKEIQTAYDEINEVLISYAQMDFSNVVKDPRSIEFLAPLQTALTMMSEELRDRAAPRNFVDISLEYIEFLAIITDTKGIIKHINSICEQVLGYKIEALLNTPVSNLFVTSPCNETEHNDANFISMSSKIFMKNILGEPVSVELTITDSKGGSPTLDGFLYIAKPLMEEQNKFFILDE